MSLFKVEITETVTYGYWVSAPDMSAAEDAGQLAHSDADDATRRAAVEHEDISTVETKPDGAPERDVYGTDGEILSDEELETVE